MSQAPPAPAAGRRYRCRDLPGTPLGSHEELVWPGPGPGRLILPVHAVELARRCLTFRTLDEHARQLCAEMGLGPGEVGTVRRELDALAAHGVLLALEDLLARCAEARRSEPARPPISTIGIVTCDRPEALRRAVTSHAEATCAADRDVEILVVDDSRDAGAGRTARARLAELAGGRNPRILYAGQEEKARFAAALAAETGVPEDLIAFALFDPEGIGRTPGANRNALLLATAGQLVLSVDDDVVGRTAPIPGAGPGLAFTSDATPWQWWFFPDRDGVLAALGPGRPDLLAAHEALLGRIPSACLAEDAGPGAGLDGASPALLGLLEAGRGRVLLTMAGRAGDSGATDPPPLGLTGPSRERLVESEAAYRTACTSREVIRGVTRTTIGDRTSCSTLVLGLDNRHLLPPFLPVGRSQDVVFGATAAACQPGACTGSLPLAVLHDPPEARAFAPGDVWRRAADYRIAWLLGDCLGALAESLVGTDPAARMRALGWRLSELASFAAGEFSTQVAVARRVRGASRIHRLEAVLEAFGESPDFWAEDVRRHIATLRDALARDDADLAHDLAAGRDPAAARALARRLVGRYGELLRAWPDLIEGARRLRARGVGLAGPVTVRGS